MCSLHTGQQATQRNNVSSLRNISRLAKFAERIKFSSLLLHCRKNCTVGNILNRRRPCDGWNKKETKWKVGYTHNCSWGTRWMSSNFTQWNFVKQFEGTARSTGSTLAEGQDSTDPKHFNATSWKCQHRFDWYQVQPIDFLLPQNSTQEWKIPVRFYSSMKLACRRGRTWHLGRFCWSWVEWSLVPKPESVPVINLCLSSFDSSWYSEQKCRRLKAEVLKVRSMPVQTEGSLCGALAHLPPAGCLPPLCTNTSHLSAWGPTFTAWEIRPLWHFSV